MKKIFRLLSIVPALAVMVLVSAPFPGHCEETEQSAPLEQFQSTEQPAVQPVAPPAPPADPLTRARTLFSEEKYDEVIRLLTGPAASNPGDFPLNILLAKAQTEKCEDLKARGDKSYKSLVKEPYLTALRLFKIDPYRAEPYYVAAKCLVINKSPTRAVRSIKKALYFSPNTPEYLITLGDGCALLGERDQQRMQKDRLFSIARDAYQKAAAGTQNEKLRAEAEMKIKALQKIIDNMGGTVYRN